MEEVFAAAFPRPRGGADGRLAGGLTDADATAIDQVTREDQLFGYKAAKIANIASAAAMRSFISQKDAVTRALASAAEARVALAAGTNRIGVLEQQVAALTEQARSAVGTSSAEYTRLSTQILNTSISLLAATIYDLYATTVVDLHDAVVQIQPGDTAQATFSRQAEAIYQRVNAAALLITQQFVTTVQQITLAPDFSASLEQLQSCTNLDGIMGWFTDGGYTRWPDDINSVAQLIANLRAGIRPAGAAATSLGLQRTGGAGTGGGQGSLMNPGGNGS